MTTAIRSDEDDEHGIQLDDLNTTTNDFTPSSNTPQSSPQHDPSLSIHLTPLQAHLLYLSHTLSMWNSRIYEYANILFAHASFPGTLLPTSLIGISETLCMILFATALGQWVDRSPNRLSPLVTSIIVNRICVAICCLLWLIIANSESQGWKRGMFGVILGLGMLEKMTRMSNVLAMERDWIPRVADERGGRGRYDLVHLNTVVRRIDISCKFLTPLVATGLMAVLPSPETTVPLFVAVFSVLSVWVEVAGVRVVWKTNGRIREPKSLPASSHGRCDGERQASRSRGLLGVGTVIVSMVSAQVAGLKFYFSTSVWIPSFGIAILHASVLDWAGTLVTWLLNAGFTYTEVTIAKGAGSIFEIGSTFVFPLAVAFFAHRTVPGADRGVYQMVDSGVKDEQNASDDDECDDEIAKEEKQAITARSDPTSLNPIVQAGKWGICSLLAMLIPATVLLFLLDMSLKASNTHVADTGIAWPDTSAFSSAPSLSILFFAFLSFSFVGRWVYDLSVTQLTQVTVSENHRSEFGGAEMALIAIFQFGHWIASAIWNDQDDFKWLGLGSLIAVAVATAGFLHWHRRWSVQ